MRSAIPIALFVVVALFVGGCGRDGSTSANAPTKAQFVKQANAICFKARQKALSSSASTPREAIRTDVVPAIGTATEELSELTPPSGDEGQFEAIVAAMEAAVTKSEGSKLAALRPVEAIFRASGAKARNYGIVQCAYG